MHFMPILSTLRRHKTAAALIILEIALTCAIVCNAIFVIRERLARMDRDSGVVEDEIVRIQVAGIRKDADAGSITAQDVAALRAIPGVRAVAVSNMIPFGASSWNTTISTVREGPAPANGAMYMGSPELLSTFGVRIIAGRDFTPEEFISYEDLRAEKAKASSIIITRALADKLYPGGNALGKPVYSWGSGEDSQTVVGIVDTLARPNDFQGPRGAGYAMVLPVRIPSTIGSYILRVDPARKGEVIAAADAALDKVDPARIVLKRQTFADIRSSYFKQDRAMAYLLFGVSLGLLVITALGIVGLASFWVQQRTRQIGIRRALGATRGDIRRYFQAENFILATLGIILGMGLAYGLNLYLMDKYQIARLPAVFLPVGAVVLWLLGQIAVLGPARRASSIPPAIATRTV